MPSMTVPAISTDVCLDPSFARGFMDPAGGTNLAGQLAAKGRHREAEPFLLGALESRRQALGREHPSTLCIVNNLANLLCVTGRKDEAEPLLREALTGFRAKLGLNHPSTLSGLNNLAGLLCGRGELYEAERLYREALEGRRVALGETHPATLATMNNLGGVLRARGRLAEAEPLYRAAYEGRRQELGPADRLTLASANDLAALLKSTGRLDQAEPLYREALEGCREHLGDRDDQTLACMNNLAALLALQGVRPERVEALYREALQGRREELGPLNPRTLLSMSNLATFLQARCRLPEAEAVYKDALDDFLSREIVHPQVLQIVRSFASLLQDHGRLQEAEPLYFRSLRSWRQWSGVWEHIKPPVIGHLELLLQGGVGGPDAGSLFREIVHAYREHFDEARQEIIDDVSFIRTPGSSRSSRGGGVTLASMGALVPLPGEPMEVALTPNSLRSGLCFQREVEPQAAGDVAAPAPPVSPPARCAPSGEDLLSQSATPPLPEAEGSATEDGSPESRAAQDGSPDSPACGEHSEAYREAVQHLADMITNECRFLRLREHKFHTEKSGKLRRKESSTPLLRFYVRGLPGVRRAKWMQPLLWSVVAVLNRCGCEATVRGGELYAPVGEGQPVRIDFAAAIK